MQHSHEQRGFCYTTGSLHTGPSEMHSNTLRVSISAQVVDGIWEISERVVLSAVNPLCHRSGWDHVTGTQSGNEFSYPAFSFVEVVAEHVDVTAVQDLNVLIVAVSEFSRYSVVVRITACDVKVTCTL